MGYQADKEADAGILRFVNEVDPGFTGILKQRYIFSLLPSDIKTLYTKCL